MLKRLSFTEIFILLAALIIIITGLTGSLFAPLDPLDVNTKIKFASPVVGHPLGTDQLGRDILSRVISGTQLALISSVVVLIIASTIGLIIGLVSGYYGGFIDEMFMRITDIFIAFPGLVLAMAVAAALGPNLLNAMAAIAIVWWPSYARLIRGQVLSIREREYVHASTALGASSGRIIIRHILPNVILPLIIQIFSDIGAALITASSLSFIGLGAQPPTPEWGSMISQGRKYILDYWWISTFPGAAILITVLIFNGLGEMIRKRMVRLV